MIKGGGDNVITVTRINDREVLINCDQIEIMEEAPDTTLTTVSGRKVIIRETMDEVLDKIVAYKRRIAREKD
jgi:flagellar protein FlbD